MNQSQAKPISFAKVVVIFAVALGVGIGLCGLDFLLASKGIGKSTVEYGVGPLDEISLIIMFLSAVGLVITTFLWVVAAIVGSAISIRKSPDPQRLFDATQDNSDDEDKSGKDNGRP